MRQASLLLWSTSTTLQLTSVVEELVLSRRVWLGLESMLLPRDVWFFGTILAIRASIRSIIIIDISLTSSWLWRVVTSQSSLTSSLPRTCDLFHGASLLLTDKTALIIHSWRFLYVRALRCLLSDHHGRIVTIPLAFRFDIRNVTA